jgi:hypothetical protein
VPGESSVREETDGRPQSRVCLARSTVWPRRLYEGSANAAAERASLGVLTAIAHSAVCNANSYWECRRCAAARQPGGALCCDTSVGDSCLSRWVATAPEHYSGSRYQRSQRAHLTCIPAYLHSSPATPRLLGLVARTPSVAAHKTCRISQTGLWRRPSVPTRQLPAAETLQSASSGWHTDARADRLPNRTLDVLARPRPPYTVHQTMYSPSAPP